MVKLNSNLYKAIVVLKNTGRTFPIYALFFAIFTVVGSLIWTFLVDGKLYYCSDKVLFLDFIPPFVHGVQHGDYWIATPGLVWFIWFLLVVLICIIPYLLVRRVRQK